jgi:hypothetical protein
MGQHQYITDIWNNCGIIVDNCGLFMDYSWIIYGIYTGFIIYLLCVAFRGPYSYI